MLKISGDEHLRARCSSNRWFICYLSKRWRVDFVLFLKPRPPFKLQAPQDVWGRLQREGTRAGGKHKKPRHLLHRRGCVNTDCVPRAP